MKALKPFIKPFEAPQRSLKIKISSYIFLVGIGARRVKNIMERLPVQSDMNNEDTNLEKTIKITQK